MQTAQMTRRRLDAARVNIRMGFNRNFVSERVRAVEERFIDIPLSEMMDALRRELRIAKKEIDDEVHFEVQSIELDLDVGVEKTQEGGISFQVLSFKTSRKDRSVQRVKLRMTAHEPSASKASPDATPSSSDHLRISGASRPLPGSGSSS